MIMYLANKAGFNPVSYMGSNLQLFKNFVQEVEKHVTMQTSTQPSKSWRSLTANTILNLMPESIPVEHDGALFEFARTIEEKLKEKNHG